MSSRFGFVARNLARQWAEDPAPFGDTIDEHIAHVLTLADEATARNDHSTADWLGYLVHMWREDPDRWGDSPADFRNELRDMAPQSAPLDDPDKPLAVSLDDATRHTEAFLSHMDWDGYLPREAAEVAAAAMRGFLSGEYTYATDVAPNCNEYCDH